MPSQQRRKNQARPTVTVGIQPQQLVALEVYISAPNELTANYPAELALMSQPAWPIVEGQIPTSVTHVGGNSFVAVYPLPLGDGNVVEIPAWAPEIRGLNGEYLAPVRYLLPGPTYNFEDQATIVLVTAPDSNHYVFEFDKPVTFEAVPQVFFASGGSCSGLYVVNTPTQITLTMTGICAPSDTGTYTMDPGNHSTTGNIPVPNTVFDRTY